MRVFAAGMLSRAAQSRMKWSKGERGKGKKKGGGEGGGDEGKVAELCRSLVGAFERAVEIGRRAREGRGGGGAGEEKSEGEGDGEGEEKKEKRENKATDEIVAMANTVRDLSRDPSIQDKLGQEGAVRALITILANPQAVSLKEKVGDPST